MDSTSIIADILISIECIALTILLFWLYNSAKINAIEFILFGAACSTFYIPFISITATPLFFISTYFFISEGVALYRNNLRLKLSLLIILFLPVLSSITISVLIALGYDIFDGNNPSVGRVLYDGVFFYVKYFLPLIFLGTKIYRESRTYDINYFFSIIRKVAIYSCYIGLFQLVLSSIIKDETILRVIGMRSNYLAYVAGGQDAANARVSAFFIEPKFLAAFLVVSIPLFLKEKKFLSLILVLIIGLLTASQTFMVGVLLAGIIFFIIKKIKNIRANVALGIIMIVIMFYSISLLKVVFLDFYSAHSDNYLVNLVLSRAVDRYNTDADDGEANMNFLGIPLQKDSDLPIALFFATKPLLYLSGYGLKNGGFVPAKYYIFDDDRVKDGSLTYNLDIRWFYFTCEFGLIIFLIWLHYFTKKFDSTIITPFENKYYAFLIVFLFFSGIELYIILLYAFYMGLSYYNKSEKVQISID
ncbi:MAG TPA: hypothetical protein VF465_20040 [Flavobacterium sp.]|uniref:hypothetical protein n=1 Tax=Flavobacterium sp. TaxID=239 RepID=UPI002ED0E191